MKIVTSFFLSTLALTSSAAMAADDSGKIVEIYAHPDGQIALKLDSGLPNSNIANNCGVSSNPWAGVATTADPIVKAAILSAYTSKSNVTLVTMGKCVGTWIKIEAMHVR